MTAGFGAATRFKKGQSGNPGGRPKAIAEIQELARQHSATVIEALVEIVEDKKASAAARVSAGIALLDRGYGKPAQYIEGRGFGRAASALSDDELAAIATGASDDADQ